MENQSDAGNGGLLTLEDVLNEISGGKDPTKIADQVELFMQQRPNLSEAVKNAISDAKYRRNNLEREKRDQQGARVRLDGSSVKRMREPPWLQLKISTSNDNNNIQAGRNPPAHPAKNNNRNNPPKRGNPDLFDMLKRICLSRQRLAKIERVCDQWEFDRLRRLLFGCLVCVNVHGETLVAEIKEVEDRQRIGKNIHLERRLFLPSVGYFAFDQISDQPPTEEEMQCWIQQHKLELPRLDSFRSKCDRLKQILGNPAMKNGSMARRRRAQPNGEGTSAGTSGQAQQNSADDEEMPMEEQENVELIELSSDSDPELGPDDGYLYEPHNGQGCYRRCCM